MLAPGLICWSQDRNGVRRREPKVKERRQSDCTGRADTEGGVDIVFGGHQASELDWISGYL